MCERMRAAAAHQVYDTALEIRRHRILYVNAMMPIGHLYLGAILTLLQQDFLRDAMLELGLTREAFAKRIGAPWETFKKWLLPVESGGSREMPAIAWSLVREVLEHERLKRECGELRTRTNNIG